MTIATHNFRQGCITNKSPCSPLNEKKGETEEWRKKRGEARLAHVT